MGQSCKSCGDSFGDYGDYGDFEFCDCRNKWCCDDCASDDGLVIDEETDERSCNYCRKEDYDNDTLLSKALKLLKLTRDGLIEIVNEETN